MITVQRGLVWLVLVGFLLAGCAGVNLQIKGAPVPENVIEARVPAPPLILTYAFVHTMKVEEGDEFLETWKYLPLVGKSSPYVAKTKNTRGLALKLEIFNPSKADYVLKVVQLKQKTEKDQQWYDNATIYEGNLSRKSFEILFPPEEHIRSRVRFEIRSIDGELCYESFEAFFKFTP